ncbi:hypothetical protein [Arthrobacter cupressi]
MPDRHHRAGRLVSGGVPAGPDDGGHRDRVPGTFRSGGLRRNAFGFPLTFGLSRGSCSFCLAIRVGRPLGNDGLRHARPDRHAALHAHP